MEAWEKIQDKHVSRKLMDNVFAKWDFHGSTSKFPGIREPLHSLTYQVSFVFAQTPAEYGELLSDLCFKSIQAFRRVVKADESVFATDVHHGDYYLRPGIKFKAKDPMEWQVPLFPNGDYSVFVLHGGQMGFFGHPWEQTICIFGTALLEAYSTYRPRIFKHLIRKDGKQVAEMEPRARAS